MFVDRTAAAVEGFASVGDDRVNFAGLGKRLQRAIHGGKAHGRSVVPQRIVPRLRRAKLVRGGQRVKDGRALAGHAGAEAPDVGVMRALLS
ncbi:hypothetical protein GCM10025876_03880 [Demequina litorisediminis]|uniref:Uncharacterized protein n=1 Tax=Demequina litorisediminis TaxID=1849022 RepID=A0ABQ6IBS5_9MICO|nr:hypothetical protein GCM10025876_03880 [Demequina litorisediminis]